MHFTRIVTFRLKLIEKNTFLSPAKKVYVSITKPQRSDDKFRRNNSQHSTVVTLSPTSDRLIRELLLDEPSPMEECNIQISFDATEMNDALISREQHTPVVPPMPRTSNPFRESRKTLPTYAYRERILDAIENNQVILISSETGMFTTHHPNIYCNTIQFEINSLSPFSLSFCGSISQSD